MALASYFIGGKYWGQAAVRDAAGSFAFFCPTCADLWARIVVKGGSNEATVLTCACERHANLYTYTYGQPPGSIIPTGYLMASEAWSGDALMPQRLPPRLLSREMLLHLTHLERMRKHAP